MTKSQDFKDKVNKQLSDDFDVYINSHEFTSRYGEVDIKTRNMLLHAYLVGGKRTIDMMKSTLVNQLKNPKKFMNILRGK